MVSPDEVQHDDPLQIRQRIFNCTDMTFDILHTFPLLVIAKLSDVKNSPVFWPTL